VQRRARAPPPPTTGGGEEEDHHTIINIIIITIIIIIIIIIIDILSPWQTFDLRRLGTKFDVILIDPPWEEYARRAAAHAVGVGKSAAVWALEELQRLNIKVSGSQRLYLKWGGWGEVDEGRTRV
jgi:hypothetical protein